MTVEEIATGTGDVMETFLNNGMNDRYKDVHESVEVEEVVESQLNWPFRLANHSFIDLATQRYLVDLTQILSQRLKEKIAEYVHQQMKIVPNPPDCCGFCRHLKLLVQANGRDSRAPGRWRTWHTIGSWRCSAARDRIAAAQEQSVGVLNKTNAPIMTDVT
jgi:hypothetical protein